MHSVKLFGISLICIVLAACANQATNDQWQLRKQLISQGVVINQVGETMQIIFPNNLLFNPGSANLNKQNENTLQTLAQLLAIFETKQMTITGFDHATSDLTYNQALALKRAQVLKNYLWRNNADARLINTVGKTWPADLAEVRIDFMYLPPVWAK